MTSLRDTLRKPIAVWFIARMAFSSPGGVCVEGPEGSLTFRWVKAPAGAGLSALANRIAGRVGRFLERQGLRERDAESASLSELALDGEPMEALLAHSITYRIAVGPRAGRKVFTLGAPAGRR